jgi:heterodisulfide reductase subunit C
MMSRYKQLPFSFRLKKVLRCLSQEHSPYSVQEFYTMPSSSLTYEAATSRPVLEELMKRSGQNLPACYQCRRCAAGCPVGEETGVTPDQLIRMVLLGDMDAALRNLLVGKCMACYTCGTRCPNSIQTARIVETLKQMAKETGLQPACTKISDFHDSFMIATKHFGRFNELEGMAIYETKIIGKEIVHGRIKAIIIELLGQARLGVALIKKRRMPFGLDKVKGQSEVKALFAKAKKRGT